MITIPRRSRIKSPFAITIGIARRMSRAKLSEWDKFVLESERRENRANGARIRRYAKKNGLALSHHRKLWYLTRDNGDTIELVAGYYVTVNKVLQRIVAA